MMDYEALKKLCDEATPGPWSTVGDPKWQIEDETGNQVAQTSQTVPISQGANAIRVANATFIAAARTAVPAMLAERDGLRAENERMRAALTTIIKRYDVSTTAGSFARAALNPADKEPT